MEEFEYPTQDSVAQLRSMLERRLAGGVTKAALARDIGMNEKTLGVFLANPSRMPHANTWVLFRGWMARSPIPSGAQLKRPQSLADAEGNVAAPLAAFYAGIAIGMARAVQRQLRGASEEQQRLIEHLTSLYGSEWDDTMNSGRTPSEPPVADWVTEAELDEDDRVMDQVESAAEKAKASSKKGKRASA